MEEKQDGCAARPFQLRPSILSGSGFGSSFGSFGSAGDKASKEFTLRPSALSSAAESTTVKSDTRKRLHDDEDPSNDAAEETTKKPKTGENEKSKSPIKLTEDIQKPVGIGTFGFGADEKQKEESNTSSGKENEASTTTTATTTTTSSKNFFELANKKDNDKNVSVFGTNSDNNSVGFNTIKCDNNTKTDMGGGNNGVSETEETSSNLDKEKLLENADEYQKSLGQKTHLKEVEKITGEEGERNVLQVFCKLYLFDKQKQNWCEKGRGTLKLNDRCHAEGIFQSRLVFRTQGTNLVLLNMMLWPDMCCERVKEKSLRITEIDPDTKEVKVYLITTAIKDSLQTYIAIDRRIEALKRNSDNNEENKGDRTSQENSNKFIPHTDDDDSSTESERISSRENSMYGPTDDSSGHTSPSPAT